jgi:hypothetical protein
MLSLKTEINFSDNIIWTSSEWLETLEFCYGAILHFPESFRSEVTEENRDLFSPLYVF